MRVWSRLQQSTKVQPIAVSSVAIFLVCVLVYSLNDRLDLTSSDNVTNTLLGFNWLQHHALNFDTFRDGYLYQGGGIPYYFLESPTGHLSSRFPIGTALVTFPLAVIYHLGLKLAVAVNWVMGGTVSLLPLEFPDVATADFLDYRRSFSKFAAIISTALAVVLFYLSTRLKFTPSVASVSTFVFAFATGSWPVCSQDLRQHTVSNLLLMSIMLCLFKVERSEGNQRRLLLFLAGVFCGILPSARITSALFSAAIFVYVIVVYRKEALYFCLGLPSILFHFGWNLYFFGWENIVVGGYIKHLDERASSYALTLQQFTSASLGLLLSPSNGLLVYSPVLLFAIPGAYRAFQQFRQRKQRDEGLILWLAIAAFALYLHFCFYLFWLGGNDSFGPRMLMDTLPISCFLIAYFLADLAPKLNHGWQGAKFVFAVFLATLMLSTLIQTLGAFTQTSWAASPIPLGADRGRLWQLADSKIERHFRNLIAQVSPPIRDEALYLKGFDAQVKEVELTDGEGDDEPVGDRLVVRSGRRRLLKVTLQNTGSSTWYGYQTGLENQGETRLRVQFYDAAGNNDTQRVGNQLYVSGTTPPGKLSIATGQIAFPKEPGEYRLELLLVAHGISTTADIATPTYSQPVTILPRPTQSGSPTNPQPLTPNS